MSIARRTGIVTINLGYACTVPSVIKWHPVPLGIGIPRQQAPPRVAEHGYSAGNIRLSGILLSVPPREAGGAGEGNGNAGLIWRLSFGTICNGCRGIGGTQALQTIRLRGLQAQQMELAR